MGLCRMALFGTGESTVGVSRPAARLSSVSSSPEASRGWRGSTGCRGDGGGESEELSTSICGRNHPIPVVKKGKFLYSAVSSPQDRSKRFTLYFPDRPVHSDTISASQGSIQPYAAINARRLLVHMSTTVYCQVLIYTAE